MYLYTYIYVLRLFKWFLLFTKLYHSSSTCEAGTTFGLKRHNVAKRKLYKTVIKDSFERNKNNQHYWSGITRPQFNLPFRIWQDEQTAVVLTFPLEDCSEFGNFVITLILYTVCPEDTRQNNNTKNNTTKLRDK
jgi:hypothetical protein